MKSGVAQIKLSPARETIADALRHAFLNGAFSPGENISDIDLAARLGVSRIPVREALVMLSLEGLVTHSQNRGFSVLQLTEEDLLQINDVRLLLETAALTRARKQVSAENLSRLRLLKDAISRALSCGDIREALQAELQFHGLIAEMSGNRWLETALKRVLTPFFTFAMAYGPTAEVNPAATVTLQHESYLELIRK